MTEQTTTNFSEIKIPVPWGHIWGRWYGDQSVRPILTLHGWLDNCGSFAKLAPLLVQTAGSLLCIDFPGHGYSTHLPPGVLYSDKEYVRVIIRVMKAYNWPKVSLMGHSMGGGVVFLFTALYPDKVDILIGIDEIKKRYVGPSGAIEYFRNAVDKVPQDNQHLQEPPSYSWEKCVQLLYKGSGQSVNLENCKYILERNLDKSRKYPERYYFSRDSRIKYIMVSYADPAFYKSLAMIISEAKIPYIVIKGGASKNIDDDSSELISIMSKQNPNFETHVIADGTHHLHLNEATVVAELIATFLKRHRTLAVFQAEQSGVKSELLAKGKL